MKEILEYAFFLLLNWVAQHLPFRKAGALGAFFGTLFFTLGYRKQITLNNLTRAFPELDRRDIMRIAQGAYRNYGTALLEMLWSSGAAAEELLGTMHVSNPEVFKQALEGGKGVIILSGHYGSWELLVGPLRLHIDRPFVLLVQHQRNQRIDALIDAKRRRFDNVTVPMGPSVLKVMRALQHGKVVIMLGDQSASKESVFVNFFGRPAATHRGAAAFSLRAGSPIVMVFLVRQTDGTYNAVFEEVDRHGLESYSEENVDELTRRHTAILEKYIRLHPDHWLWMHKRWKHTEYYEAMRHNISSVGSIEEGVG